MPQMQHFKQSARIVYFVFFLLSIPAGISAAQMPGFDRTANINPGKVPAKGRQEAYLEVSGFGRYAVMAQSDQATAIQLIDRMAGPGPVKGSAGGENGRLDVILEKGVYKVVAYSHEKGKGDAVLKVHPFQELNRPVPPRLVENKNIITTLNDFQQRSYWLEIKARRHIAIEAAGRNLADLRIWRDGSWLADITPDSGSCEPQTGKPMNVKQIVADLNPGLYLVTAYGGIQNKWAAQASETEHPLYIRFGMPTLGAAGRHRYITSEFGKDRFLVPATANYFRLELAQAGPALISIAPYQENNPYNSSGKILDITKKSMPPVAETTVSSHNQGYYVVTVQRPAGTPYILQHFKAVRHYDFRESGEYWISTLHSGHGQDAVDATALMTERRRNGRTYLKEHSTVVLDAQTGFKRKFNLLDELTLFLEVKNRGTFIIEGEGAKAEFKVEPFQIYRPQNYKSPKFRGNGEWALDPGFYEFTAKPEQEGKGILQLTIFPKDTSKQLIEFQKPQTSVIFQEVSLERSRHYTIHLNKQPGVQTGVLLRKIPIDIRQPLPVTQKPGEKITLDIEVPEEGTISAIQLDGTKLPIHINKTDGLVDPVVNRGRINISISNDTADVIAYSVHFHPKRLDPSTPLPSITDEQLAKLPDFPIIKSEDPSFFDVGEREQKTFLVTVAKPNLYRLESTGLLQTMGNLRTRTIPSFDRQSANGIGRNFLIHQYLKDGDYQLSIEPQGKTRGHMGLRLKQTRIHEDGRLLPGIPARFSLPAGQGLLYRFTIPEKGRYHLKALGLDRNFLMRLEDEHGWPLLKPGSNADIDQEFLPGNYRMMVLPQSVSCRIITVLRQIEDEKKFEGHGPHEIRLNRQIVHPWYEPEEGEPRTQDQWRFNLPATVDAVIEIDDQMVGSLYRDSNLIAELDNHRIWEKQLSPGNYELRLKSRRKNNRYEYHFQVATRQLVAGYEHTVTTPCIVPVSIGEEKLVEISSFGDQDVRASLSDAQGRMIKSNDDRLNDWNFHIAEKLLPGFYNLKVDPVGDKHAVTKIRMYLPEQIDESPQTIAFKKTIQGDKLFNIPLIVKSYEQLQVISAVSKDTVGISLEHKTADGWKGIGSSIDKNPFMAVMPDRTESGAQYRLKVWSADKRGSPIHLAVQSFPLKQYKEAQLIAKGVVLEQIKGVQAPIGAAQVQLERDGVFEFDSEIESLYRETGRNRVLTHNSSDFIIADSKQLYLIAKIDNKHSNRVQAQRVPTATQKDLQIVLPPEKASMVDLSSPSSGPVMLLVQSRTGQPGVSFHHKSGQMAVSMQSAIDMVIDPEQADAAYLWNAGNDYEKLPVSIRQINFSKPKQMQVKWGANDIDLAPQEGYLIHTSPGSKEIEMNLPGKTAAILLKGDATQRLFWTGETSRSISLPMDSDTVMILHAGSSHAKGRIMTIPEKENNQDREMNSKSIIRAYRPAVGETIHDIALSKSEKTSGMVFHIMGKDADAVMIQNNGYVRRGRKIQINDDGQLTIRHATGILLAWLENDRSTPFDAFEGRKSVTLLPPAKLNLEGNIINIKLNLNESKLIHLGTSCPVISYFQASQGAHQTRFHQQGAVLDIFMPAGPSTITLISATQGTLFGQASLTESDIIKIKEGLGPLVRMVPGRSRLFSFELKEDSAIGVGVNASKDKASCLLYDSKANILGKGVIQMHDLPAGHYVLEVRLPATSHSIEIRPAVVGIEKPGAGPPEDVIKNYLDIVGLKPE